MKKVSFSIDEIMVLEAGDVLQMDALSKIKGGIAKSTDCDCGSSNANTAGGSCTCGSGNSNKQDALSFA